MARINRSIDSSIYIYIYTRINGPVYSVHIYIYIYIYIYILYIYFFIFFLFFFLFLFLLFNQSKQSTRMHTYI